MQEVTRVRLEEVLPESYQKILIRPNSAMECHGEPMGTSSEVSSLSPGSKVSNILVEPLET